MSSGGMGAARPTWPSRFNARPSVAERELIAHLALITATGEKKPPTAGACSASDVDPELFWPVSKNDPAAEAKTVCARCPVLAECARYGMTQDEGVWGGMTEDERHTLRRQAERHRAELERLVEVAQAAPVAEVA